MIFQSFPARAQRYAARARPGQTRPGARAIQHYTRQHFLGFDSSLLALTLLISPVRALRCIRHPITEKWVNGTRRWFPLQQQRSVQSVERMNKNPSVRLLSGSYFCFLRCGEPAIRAGSSLLNFSFGKVTACFVRRRTPSFNPSDPVGIGVFNPAHLTMSFQHCRRSSVDSTTISQSCCVRGVC